MLAAKAVANLKRRCAIPEASGLFSDEDLIDFINEEYRSSIMPWILNFREEHFIASVVVPVEGDRSYYSIPSRSLGGTLRDLQVQNQNGDRRSIVRLWEEDRGKVTGEGFYTVGNEIELQPKPTAPNFSLRMVYQRRPSELVNRTQCAQIESIDRANKIVTIDSLPSGFSGSAFFDVVSSVSPFAQIDDLKVVGISGFAITFDSLPEGVVEGSFVCLPTQSPVIQLPSEYCDILLQAVSVKLFEAMAQNDQVKTAQAKLDVAKMTMQNAVNPRVQGEAKRIRPNALSRFWGW